MMLITVNTLPLFIIPWLHLERAVPFTLAMFLPSTDPVQA